MMLLITPHQAKLTIATHLRQHRLDCMYTQQDLAKRSGVPLATLRKFERTGDISLESFLKITVILGVLEGVVNTVAPKNQFNSLDEILASKKRKPRQRVRK